MQAGEPISSESRSVLAVERAMDVLDVFEAQGSAPLGITEIAQKLDLSKTIVHRIVTALCVKNYMMYDPWSKRYSLGPAALSLGMSYLSTISVRDRARSVMYELTEKTNETSTLSIRSGNNRVYVDQINPQREVRVIVALGRPYPLYAGAPSKVFLAFLPEKDRENYTANELSAFTPETIVNPEELREELEVIRTVGHAISTGERRMGAVSVAAPVFDHQGATAAVISVCGPYERFLPRVSSVVPILMAATAEVSASLGFGLQK